MSCSRILLGMLLVFVLTTGASGCVQKNEVAIVPLTELASHLGETVYTEGCLYFACPTVPGALYPRDCKVVLRDGDARIALEFPPEKEALRKFLDNSYEDHFGRCIRLTVRGTVEEVPCSTPECVPVMFLTVQELRIEEP